MKELSIEEKAQRYDEAIKVANKYKDTRIMFPTIKYKMFPELEESEDEKIRKHIVTFIMEADKMGDAPEESANWLAWLAKQGEQKLANSAKTCKEEKTIVIIPKFRIGDEIKTSNEESLIITKIDEKGYWSEDLFICDFDEECLWDLVEQNPAWLEKQGEQKLTELSNTCEFSMKTWIDIVAYVLKEHNGIGNYLDNPEVKDTAEKLQKKYKFDSASEEWDRVYRKGLDAGVNKGKAIALREKNPAWSKEDENFYDYLLGELNASLIDYCGASLEDMKKAIGWFKSIKDRVQTKTKQGLDENTQQWIDAIIKDYEELYDANKDHMPTIQVKINILKFLKDRYTWKPSDEQMEYLSAAIEESNENSVLESLYQDLKKLKE